MEKHKNAEFIIAFAEGKEVELLVGKWRLVNKLEMFDILDPHQLRIKPAPKIVAFTFEDAEFLIGKPVKSKPLKGLVIKDVLMVSALGVKTVVIIGSGVFTYQEFLDKFTFLDGKVCGKEAK